MTDKVQKIREELARLKEETSIGLSEHDNGVEQGRMEIINALSPFLDSLQKEPESAEFEDALIEEWNGYVNRGAATVDALEDNTQELAFSKGFYRGAKWQEEKDSEEKVLTYKHGFDDCKKHFEKNRLAACDKQTEEEAEREQDFVMGIIENEHRQPTFDDAIKYGMRLQKEQMMKDAIDLKINRDTLYDLKPIIHEKYLDYKIGDKVKVIIVKDE